MHESNRGSPAENTHASAVGKNAEPVTANDGENVGKIGPEIGALRIRFQLNGRFHVTLKALLARVRRQVGRGCFVSDNEA